MSHLQQRIRDKRFYAWPPVYRDGGVVRLRAKFFSPRGFLALENLVLKPLQTLWGTAWLFLTLHWVLVLIQGLNACFIMPVEPKIFFWGLVITGALWCLDLRWNYKIMGMLFRRVLIIELRGETMKIGGRFKKHTIVIDSPVSFAMRGYNHTEDRVYRVARKFELIIDQTRRVRLAALIDGEEAEQLVSNANLMLTIHEERDDQQVDIDQTQEALRRALRGGIKQR